MTAGSDLRAWFLGRVDLSDLNGCWEWRNTHDRDGYARATYYIKGRVYSAAGHRLAYELLVGEIADELVIDHLCRNRGCVNPCHMEIVTRGENVRRGLGVALRPTRTHCPAGHEYTPENTSLWHRPGRRPKQRCRTCQKVQDKERRKSRTPNRNAP